MRRIAFLSLFLFLVLMAGCSGGANDAFDVGAEKEASVIATGCIDLGNTGTYTYLPWNVTCTSDTTGDLPYASYYLKSWDGATTIAYLGSTSNEPTYPITVSNSYPIGYYRLEVELWAKDPDSPYTRRRVATDWCYVIDRD